MRAHESDGICGWVDGCVACWLSAGSPRLIDSSVDPRSQARIPQCLALVSPWLLGYSCLLMVDLPGRFYSLALGDSVFFFAPVCLQIFFILFWGCIVAALSCAFYAMLAGLPIAFCLRFRLLWFIQFFFSSFALLGYLPHFYFHYLHIFVCGHSLFTISPLEICFLC